MRVNKIYLFKVPFDNTYKNVFDFSTKPAKENFSLEFHNFLHSNFTNVDYTLNAIRSIKTINFNSVFTLPLNSYDLKDYNYIEIISDDNKRVFYFITDYTSENDSINNPSTSINIEFDVWHNNLGELQDDNNFDENFVERCHQSRFVDTIGGLRRIYSTTPEDFGDFALKRSYIESKYKVLWLCLQFDDGVTLNEFGEFVEVATSAIPSITGTPIVYLPFILYENDVLKPFKFSLTSLSDYRNFYPSSKFLSKISTILTNNHLINATLTYAVPFRYNIISSNNEITVNVVDDDYFGFCTIGTVLNTWNVNGILSFFVCGYKDKISEDDVNQIFNYKDIFSIDNNSYSVNRNEILNPNIKHVKNGESKFFNYPFNYFSFVVNDIERNLVCRNLYDTLQLIIEKNCSLTPTISFFENGVKDVLQSFIIENGQCILNKDILQEYWRNNSTKLLTNTVSNAINNITTTFSGKKRMDYLLGVSNNKKFKDTKVNSGEIAEDLISTGASLIDMSKQRDIISQPQFIAQNDLKFQNNVRVYKNEVFTEETINSIIYTFMRYGYNLFSKRSLREINRHWFDYVKTNNCYLPFIKNYNERYKVQDIYNSGVTKWHITNNVAKIDFDFTINNPEVEFVTVEETKLSTPTNLSITYNTLRWDYVENATDYKVYFNGELIFTTKANFLNLVGLIPENSSGNITIIATANGYIDSFSSESISYSNINYTLEAPTVTPTPNITDIKTIYFDTRTEKLVYEIQERNSQWRQIYIQELTQNEKLSGSAFFDIYHITEKMSFEEWGSEEVTSSIRVRAAAINFSPSSYTTVVEEFDFLWVDVNYSLDGCSFYALDPDNFRINPRYIPSINSTVNIFVSPYEGATFEDAVLSYVESGVTQTRNAYPYEYRDGVYNLVFAYATKNMGNVNINIYYSA